MLERDVFVAALRKNRAERAAYLADACGDDPELRRRVEELLVEHEKEHSFFLDAPWAGIPVTVDPPIKEKPGTQIGPYKLLQQIGEGGMGVVFMAEQLEPVRRKVALKVIKPGMDTRQVIARFGAERQALAVMDHPNISRVLEAGATDSGRPYFVMELVRGVPITAYCDQHNLPVRDRLELFASVCQAIQHAHTKGIIHRDIKPTNVLVTRHDGKGVVKVIDFGVAKAVGQQLTEKTLFTEFAQMVGTPLYMSPEQAELSSLDIDTRSDVYSLGVLLYELLTGSTPVDTEQMKKAAFDEIRRIIREDEPQRPSTRISGSQTLSTIAAHRHIEPARLSKLLRGELDWIVMKALEKDRSRRYETASGLGSDVEHYLQDEPVLACPPSPGYRLRKLAWRHKRTVAAAATVAIFLLLTVVTLAVSNSWIRREQARTEGEKVRAEKAQRLAEGRAEEIRQGLERLKAANSALERGRWYVGQQRWDDANNSFTKAVELRPDHASAWVERGDLYAHLGLWDLASADFEREFELREPDATIRWYRRALLRLYLGDTEGYRRACLRMRERFRGTLHVEFAGEVARTLALAAGPQEEMQTPLELAQHAHLLGPETWYDQYILGVAEYRSGHYEQAALWLQKSLAALPECEVRQLSYPVLAMAYHRLGRTSEARAALRSAAEAIDRWTRARYGAAEGTPWVTHFGATPNWPIGWWDWVECQLYYREAKLLIDGASAPHDPRLLVLRARAFAGMRRNFTADVEYAAALELLPDDPQVRVEAHRSAAYSAIGRQQWRLAYGEFTKASELTPDDAALWRYQAVAALGAGDVAAYEQVCAAMLKRLGKEPRKQIAYQIVWTCALQGDAVADADRLLALARIAAPSYHDGAEVLLAALYRAGKHEEAVACFEAVARIYTPSAWEWVFLAMAHHRLGHRSEARRCLAEARGWIDSANRQTEVDLSGALPAWGAWHGPVVYPLLVREAEEMLETTSEDRGPATGKRNQKAGVSELLTSETESGR